MDTDKTNSAAPAAASPAKPPRRLPRFAKGILIVILFGAVAPVAFHVILGEYRNRAGERALAPVLARAREAGLPLTYSDAPFPEWENPDPSDANAASIYSRAFEMSMSRQWRGDFVPLEGTKGDLPDDPREPLPVEMLDAGRRFVQGRTDVLDLLHEAAGVEPCRFAIHWKGFETALPHLARLRRAERLMAVAVMVAAEDDRPREAAGIVHDGLALARRPLEEPSELSLLVGLAGQGLVLAGMERLLSRCDLSPDELAYLQNDLEDSAARVTFKRAMSGGIALESDMCSRLLEWRGIEDMEGEKSCIPDCVMRYSMWLTRGDMKKVQALVCSEIIDLAGAEALGPALLDGSFESAFRARLDALPLHFDYTRLGVMGMSTWFASIRSCASAKARLDAAAACVAAVRFRADHGAWPETLSSLVPAYLKAVPPDPYTGASLLYKADADGVRVYSVGQNGRDEDGRQNLVIRPGDVSDAVWYAADDVGFRVWK